MRDLHLVRHGPDDVRAYVPLVVEGFQAAPDARPLVGDQGGFATAAGGAVAGVVGVDPLLDFDDAGAVVELVGGVCWLGGDVADLSDEGYLEGRERVSGGVWIASGRSGGVLGLSRRRRLRIRRLGGVVGLEALALSSPVGACLCHRCPERFYERGKHRKGITAACVLFQHDLIESPLEFLPRNLHHQPRLGLRRMLLNTDPHQNLQ